MAKKKQRDFHLFKHQETELKNGLIEEARELIVSERFSGRLAAAMIYVSLARGTSRNSCFISSVGLQLASY